MISIIDGQVESRGGDDKSSYIDVMVNGVGYRVNIPVRSGVKVGEDTRLYTAFIVREDSQTLYGYETVEERNIFELLTSVSGIGPKIALATLSLYSAEEVNSLIISGDHDSLSIVSGLGKKGAQKIVLELQEKVSKLGISLVDGVKSKVDNTLMKEVRAALSTLGFSGQDLNGYLEVADDILSAGRDIDIEGLIKLVLSGGDESND